MKHILRTLWIFVLCALSLGTSKAEELDWKCRVVRFFTDPIWNPDTPAAWNLAKASGYAAGAWDAWSTSEAQKRALTHGFTVRELNLFDNAFIDSRKPEVLKRQLSSFAVQWAFNKLLDFGYSHASARWKDRLVMFGLRGGLTADSVRAKFHNDTMGRQHESALPH